MLNVSITVHKLYTSLTHPKQLCGMPDMSQVSVTGFWCPWQRGNNQTDLSEITRCSSLLMGQFFFIMSEIGFIPMWNWISSNVILDVFQCKIRFLPIWQWISFNVKLDFFICDIGFLPIWNWISLRGSWIYFNVKLDFCWYKNLLLFIFILKLGLKKDY